MDPWVLGIGHSSGRADNAEITLVAAEENLWRTVVDTPATAGIPEVLAFRGMLGAHIDIAGEGRMAANLASWTDQDASALYCLPV